MSAPQPARAIERLLDRGARAFDRGAALCRDGARTARFLRGRLRFDARGDDVFVASYPRSGTTFTQLIVYYLVSGMQSADFDHISDVSPWFERSLAHRDDAIAELASLPSPRVFKTHLPLSWLPRGARYIYVRRQPEDVLVSYFHLYRRYLRFEGDLAAFFARFMRGDVQYRSWFEHVADWQAHRDDDAILVVDYELLVADTAAAIAHIARHIGVAVSPRRVAEIERLTAFATMKADEQKFDHIGELVRQWGVRSGAFLRAGAVGHGAESMTPAQREALRRAAARAEPRRRGAWQLPAFLH